MVSNMEVGNLVVLKNDESSIIYKIIKIEGNEVYLKGYTHRVKLIVLIDEIKLAEENKITNEDKVASRYQKHANQSSRQKTVRRPIFGRILHIDGDKEYLDSCLDLYKEVGVHADGIYISEDKIKDKIEELIEYLTPDIVVITGHDIYNQKGIKELKNYENTTNFMEAVRKIRKHYLADEVCVIAGACGSNYEALIASGANFASSPKRINIHTYDPAVIAIRVASTSINKVIDFESCLKLIENGRDAVGGIETKGKMKIFL